MSYDPPLKGIILFNFSMIFALQLLPDSKLVLYPSLGILLLGILSQFYTGDALDEDEEKLWKRADHERKKRALIQDITFQKAMMR